MSSFITNYQEQPSSTDDDEDNNKHHYDNNNGNNTMDRNQYIIHAVMDNIIQQMRDGFEQYNTTTTTTTTTTTNHDTDSDNTDSDYNNYKQINDTKEQQQQRILQKQVIQQFSYIWKQHLNKYHYYYTTTTSTTIDEWFQCIDDIAFSHDSNNNENNNEYNKDGTYDTTALIPMVLDTTNSVQQQQQQQQQQYNQSVRTSVVVVPSSILPTNPTTVWGKIRHLGVVRIGMMNDYYYNNDILSPTLSYTRMEQSYGNNNHYNNNNNTILQQQLDHLLIQYCSYHSIVQDFVNNEMDVRMQSSSSSTTTSLLSQQQQGTMKQLLQHALLSTNTTTNQTDSVVDRMGTNDESDATNNNNRINDSENVSNTSVHLLQDLLIDRKRKSRYKKRYYNTNNISNNSNSNSNEQQQQQHQPSRLEEIYRLKTPPKKRQRKDTINIEHQSQQHIHNTTSRTIILPDIPRYPYKSNNSNNYNGDGSGNELLRWKELVHDNHTNYCIDDETNNDEWWKVHVLINNDCITPNSGNKDSTPPSLLIGALYNVGEFHYYYHHNHDTSNNNDNDNNTDLTNKQIQRQQRRMTKVRLGNHIPITVSSIQNMMHQSNRGNSNNNSKKLPWSKILRTYCCEDNSMTTTTVQPLMANIVTNPMMVGTSDTTPSPIVLIQQPKPQIYYMDLDIGYCTLEYITKSNTTNISTEDLDHTSRNDDEEVNKHQPEEGREEEEHDKLTRTIYTFTSMELILRLINE